MTNQQLNYARKSFHDQIVDALSSDGVKCDNNTKHYDEQGTFDAKDTGNRGLFNIYNTRINQYQDILCSLIGEKRLKITEVIPAIDFYHTENTSLMSTYPITDGIVDRTTIVDIPNNNSSDVYNNILIKEDQSMVNRIAAGENLSEYVFNVDNSQFADTYNLLVSGDLGDKSIEYNSIADPQIVDKYVSINLVFLNQEKMKLLNDGNCTFTVTLNQGVKKTEDTYAGLSQVYLDWISDLKSPARIVTKDILDSGSDEDLANFTRFSLNGNAVTFTVNYKDQVLIAKPKSYSDQGSTNFMIVSLESSNIYDLLHTEVIDGQEVLVDTDGNTFEVDTSTGKPYTTEDGKRKYLDLSSNSSFSTYTYYLIPFLGDEDLSWTETEDITDIRSYVSPGEAFPNDIQESDQFSAFRSLMKTTEYHVSDASGFLLGLYSIPYDTTYFPENGYTMVNKWRFIDPPEGTGLSVGTLYNPYYLLNRGDFIDSPLSVYEKDSLGNISPNRINLNGSTLPNNKKVEDYPGLATLLYDLISVSLETCFLNTLMDADSWKRWTNQYSRNYLEDIVSQEDLGYLVQNPKAVSGYPLVYQKKQIIVSEINDKEVYSNPDIQAISDMLDTSAPIILTRGDSELDLTPAYKAFRTQTKGINRLQDLFPGASTKEYSVDEDGNTLITDSKVLSITKACKARDNLVGTKCINGVVFRPRKSQDTMKVLSFDVNNDSRVVAHYTTTVNKKTNSSSYDRDDGGYTYYENSFGSYTLEQGGTREAFVSNFGVSFYLNFNAYLTGIFTDKEGTISAWTNFFLNWNGWRETVRDSRLKSMFLTHVDLQGIDIISPIDLYQRSDKKADTLLVYPSEKSAFPGVLYLISRKDIGLETKVSDTAVRGVNPKSIVTFMNNDKALAFCVTQKSSFILSDIDFIEITGSINVPYRNAEEVKDQPIYGFIPWQFDSDHDCYIYKLEPYSMVSNTSEDSRLANITITDPLKNEQNLFSGISDLSIVPFATPGYFTSTRVYDSAGYVTYKLRSSTRDADFDTLKTSIIIPGVPNYVNDNTGWKGKFYQDTVSIDAFQDLYNSYPIELAIQKSLLNILGGWPMTTSTRDPIRLFALADVLDGLTSTANYLKFMADENFEVSYKNTLTGENENHTITSADLTNLLARMSQQQDLIKFPEGIDYSIYLDKDPSDSFDPSNGIIDYLTRCADIQVKHLDQSYNLISFSKTENLLKQIFNNDQKILRSDCEALDAIFGNDTSPLISFGADTDPMSAYVQKFRDQVNNVAAKRLSTFNALVKNTIHNRVNSAVQEVVNAQSKGHRAMVEKAKHLAEAYSRVYGEIVQGFIVSYDETTGTFSCSVKDRSTGNSRNIDLNAWGQDSFAKYCADLRYFKSAFMGNGTWYRFDSAERKLSARCAIALSDNLTVAKNNYRYKTWWWWTYPYTNTSLSDFWNNCNLGGDNSWYMNSFWTEIMKSLIEDFIIQRSQAYRDGTAKLCYNSVTKEYESLDVGLYAPVQISIKASCKLNFGDSSNSDAFNGGGYLYNSVDFVPQYTEEQIQEYLDNSEISPFALVKPITGNAYYRLKLPVVSKLDMSNVSVDITITDNQGETVDKRTLTFDGIYEYISDLGEADINDAYTYKIPDIVLPTYNDVNADVLQGLVTFIKKALYGVTSDSNLDEGVRSLKNSGGPTGNKNSLYYKRYTILNKRLNPLNGTLAQARNFQNTMSTVKEMFSATKTATEDAYENIMAVIPVESMTAMTFLPAQEETSNQYSMNSKFYYTQFLEEMRNLISDKCILTCTKCSVKNDCPYYNENEVLKLYVPQADSIELWLKDNELDLLWDQADEDIVLEAKDANGNSKYLRGDFFRELHKPYAEVTKHIDSSGNVTTYDVSPLTDLQEKLSQLGDDYQKNNTDDMGWIIGGRYGTLQYNSAKDIDADGYDKDLFPKYRYLYDAVFIHDEETYIKYAKSPNAYHVSLDYKGDTYEGDVHIKMPSGLLFTGEGSISATDDVYLVSDDVKDSQGNDISPVIYLNTVEKLSYYFDLNTSHDTSEVSEISVNEVDGVDASGRYVSAASSSAVSRIPRSSNDYILYPKDVAQWCINYAKGNCIDNPLSDSSNRDKDQFWMTSLKKKCSYKGDTYWIDVPGRTRSTANYSETTVPGEDSINPYHVISGKMPVNTYVNFTRKVSFNLESWNKSGTPEYIGNRSNCPILWVKNYTGAEAVERQRYTLSQMKTNLRLVIVKNA